MELLVVLAILAVVTGLALRSVDRVEEQRRYEAALRGMQEISDAVLGSPEDRAADGSYTVSGFVADMGRLPRTGLSTNETEVELSELWNDPGVAFEIRPAVALHGVPPADVDPRVLVPGGWRGPYLRLPLATNSLSDGWGNPVTSPVDAASTEYARLRDDGDNPIITPGQEVRMIRILGSNGIRNPSDVGYDKDIEVPFSGTKWKASITGNVEVLDGDSPATPDNTKRITLRIYGPHPANAAQIAVVVSEPIPFQSNPITFSIPLNAGATIGPRMVRAYLHGSSTPEAQSAEKFSAVKPVTLRGGANFLSLTIDR